MKTFTIGWLNKCRCGNKSHTVKTARGNETALWDDDAVKCNSCGRGGVIQVCEGQARVLWETDEEMAEGKPMSTIIKEFTKEQLQQIEAAAKEVMWPVVWSEKKAREHFSEKITPKVVLKLARIALASIEAEPVVSHIGSKNALDAIVAFIKSNRNPTLKDHNEVSERLFQDNCHGISNHVIEYIKMIGEELEELRNAQDSAQPAPVSVPAELTREEYKRRFMEEDEFDDTFRGGWNACLAAMLNGGKS